MHASVIVLKQTYLELPISFDQHVLVFHPDMHFLRRFYLVKHPNFPVSVL